MVKSSYMKPQDIVILFKKMTNSGRDMLNKDIALSVGISASEVSESMERCRVAQLVDSSKKRVNVLGFMDFLIYGLKYVFPVVPGALVRGVPTYLSAEPIKSGVSAGRDVFVWPDKKGTLRGQTIAPLYSSVPEAVRNDNELYELLVIADALRIGKARERDLAIKELEKKMNEYGAR